MSSFVEMNSFRYVLFFIPIEKFCLVLKESKKKKIVDSKFVKKFHEQLSLHNEGNCYMASIWYLLMTKNLCTALDRILYEKWVGKDLHPHQDNRHTLLFLLGLRLVCRAAVPVIKRTLYLQKLLPMGHHWVAVQRQVQASHLHLVTASIWKGGSVPKKRMAVRF